MSLPVGDIPTTINILKAALRNWKYTEPIALSRYRRDYEWNQPGRQVNLGIWDSASKASVIVSYVVGGSEMAHLVLTSPDQIVSWLRVVNAVTPTVAQVAEALLTDTTKVGA